MQCVTCRLPFGAVLYVPSSQACGPAGCHCRERHAAHARRHRLQENSDRALEAAHQGGSVGGKVRQGMSALEHVATFMKA